MAGKQKPSWHLSFDISPNLTIGRDGEAIHKATAIAKRGDLAYMAELELVNWSEDIAAFFEQVIPFTSTGWVCITYRVCNDSCNGASTEARPATPG